MFTPKWSWARWSLFLLFLLLVGNGLLSHYAPRAHRAFFRYILWDMIIIPPMNIFTASPENYDTTQLPLYEVIIPPQGLDTLHKDPPRSYFEEYVPARFVENGRGHAVKVRYRGDTSHHVGAGQRKSLRVRFRRNDLFEGVRLLNLTIPKGRTLMSNYLADWLGRRMGLLAVRSKFVHLRTNGVYQGVFLSRPQTDELFLFNLGRTFGEIYDNDGAIDRARGSIDKGDDAFDYPDHWRKLRAFSTRTQEDFRFLKALVAELDAETPLVDGHEALDQLVDLDAMSRFLAFLVIAGVTHWDRVHNVRLYLDPTHGKFEPIVWDQGGFGNDMVYDDYESDIPLDIPLQKLSRRLLLTPPVVNRRNEVLWDLIHKSLPETHLLKKIEVTAERIRPDLKSDAYRTHGFRKPHRPLLMSDWSDNIRKLKRWVVDRYAFLKSQLQSTQCGYLKVPGGFDFRVGGANAVDISLESPAGLTAGLTADSKADWNGSIIPYIDLDQNHRLDPTDWELSPLETDSTRVEYRFYPPRRPVSIERLGLELFAAGEILKADRAALYPLRFHGAPEGLEGVVIEVRDSVTGFRLENKNAISMTSKPQWPPEPLQKQSPQTVVWRGVVSVTGTRRFTSKETLIIEPGTRIEFDQEANLYITTKVVARGTPERPILFVPNAQASRFGSVVIEGRASRGSIFEHCRFERAFQARIGAARFLGGVSAYNTEITFKNCDWVECEGEDALNAKHAEYLVSGCRFLRCAGDGFDSDFSKGLIDGCLFYFNRDDGLDLGTSSPVIRDSLFVSQLDKGLSVGEASSPIIENCLFYGNGAFGMAIKDRSTPSISHCVFSLNGTGVGLYRKKSDFGGSRAEFANCLFVKNDKDVSHDYWSQYEARFCLASSRLIGRNNAVSGNPLLLPGNLNALAAAPIKLAYPLEGSSEIAGLERELMFAKPQVPASLNPYRATKDR